MGMFFSFKATTDQRFTLPIWLTSLSKLPQQLADMLKILRAKVNV
jgi:hypothetical protein